MKYFIYICFFLFCGRMLAQKQEKYFFDCTMLDSMYQLIEQKKINIESEIENKYLDGHTPLTLSCSCGSNYLQKKYNIDVNYVSPNLYNRPLIFDVLASQNKTLIDSFIRQGADMNQRHEYYNTLYHSLPISVAAQHYKDTSLIQYLLDKGAGLYYPQDSLTTLWNAVYNDNPDVFFFFWRKLTPRLQHIALQDTLLAIYSLNNYLKLTQFLTARYDFRAYTQWTKLSGTHVKRMPFVNELVYKVVDRIEANYEKMPEVVPEGKRLLEDWFRRGIRINVINGGGGTLLFFLGKVPHMGSWLVQQGLEVNTKNQYGKTALDVIISDFYRKVEDELEVMGEYQINDSLESIEELIGYGAVFGERSTPPKQYLVFEAVRRNKLKFVQLLIKRGYDFSIPDENGHSLLEIAYKNRFWELGQLLENTLKK